MCLLLLVFVWVLGFDVAKTGDARIGFVGFPSVGKSTLLSNLAGVYSEVAAYEFTTLTTVPGVIRYKGAKIQVSQGAMMKRLRVQAPSCLRDWVPPSEPWASLKPRKFCL